MKRHMWTAMILALAVTGPAFAQISDEAAMTIEVILANEDKIFFESLGLTPEQEQAFRPLYNEYNDASDKVMASRIAMIKGFMENRGKLSETKAQEMIDQYFAIVSMRLDLQKEYASKFAEVLPTAKVARFIQIENKIRALVDLKLAESLPLVH